MKVQVLNSRKNFLCSVLVKHAGCLLHVSLIFAVSLDSLSAQKYQIIVYIAKRFQFACTGIHLRISGFKFLLSLRAIVIFNKVPSIQ